MRSKTLDLNPEPLTHSIVLFCGSVPMIFIRRFTRPFVAFAHLNIPKFAQRSRESALAYSKEIPSQAVLRLSYMRWGLYNRSVEVAIGDLIPAKSATKLLTWRNKNTRVDPGPWHLRTLTEFYVDPKGGVGKATRYVVPGVWENVYKKIMGQRDVPTWKI